MYHVVGTVPLDTAIDDCSIDSVGPRKQFTLFCLKDAHPRVVLSNVADEVTEPANRALLTPGKKLCLLVCRMERVLKRGDSRIVWVLFSRLSGVSTTHSSSTP